MIILLYILIAHLSFIVLLKQGNVISDKQYFESLFWSYCWPFDLFYNGNHAPFYERMDKCVQYVTDINEKSRNFLYFALFGIGEETTN